MSGRFCCLKNFECVNKVWAEIIPTDWEIRAAFVNIWVQIQSRAHESLCNLIIDINVYKFYLFSSFLYIYKSFLHVHKLEFLVFFSRVYEEWYATTGYLFISEHHFTSSKYFQPFFDLTDQACGEFIFFFFLSPRLIHFRSRDTEIQTNPPPWVNRQRLMSYVSEGVRRAPEI